MASSASRVAAAPLRPPGTVARVDPRVADGRSAREHTAGVEMRVGAALVLLVALGGLYFAWRPSSGTVDSWFLTLIHGTDNGILSSVTELRAPWFVVAGSVVACVLTLRRDRPRALACLVGPPAALVVGELVVKPLVGRTLGPATSAGRTPDRRPGRGVRQRRRCTAGRGGHCGRRRAGSSR